VRVIRTTWNILFFLTIAYYTDRRKNISFYSDRQTVHTFRIQKNVFAIE